VLDGLDLQLAGGEALAVVGTNGSGKSTLLRAIVGLLAPLEGTLEVLGAAPGANPARVAYVSQFHHQSGTPLPIRARDVVRMGRFAARGLLGRLGPEDEALVDAGIEAMGIAHLARRPLRDLSGGQRQRFYLARALARRGDLLALDEPTAGLDAPGYALYEAALAGERERGAAVVVATHDIGEAMRCDRVLLLAGRVVALGTPDEVLVEDYLVETFGTVVAQRGGRLIVLEREHGHDH
jgi:ABC-type Mn2+/Zn2+ transport system ATPase subunit